MAGQQQRTRDGQRKAPPEQARDEGYEALEAEAGNEDDIEQEADELSVVDADEPLDEDIADADPTELRIETASSDAIERDVGAEPDPEREPPSNYDQPRVFPPRGAEPTTGGHNLEDLDAEGDWPDE